MDDEGATSSPKGRDIAGAWLVCLLIAMLALGLTSRLHGGMPPAATEVTAVSPCSSTPGSVCQPSRDAAGVVAGLHRLDLPKQRPGEQRPRG
jgi:hypothetical protein